MISSQNKASNRKSEDSDFTIHHYKELLAVANKTWSFASYESIPWEARFILWRHDVDFSLNRSLVLAEIEHDLGVTATYFINPHSEFYNLCESGQREILRKIISLGHEVGLHLDVAYHNVLSESELDEIVASEANFIEKLCGKRPTAFSFHNPIALHLGWEKEEYGGLLNCYSNRLKHEVSYCSDSNGYWRFRRLYSVLTEANDPCLQVLTHPGWWMDKAMPPRQRIFRSAHGRALATMRSYDSGLEEHGRVNQEGRVNSLRFLCQVQPKSFELCAYLWSNENINTLFLELWRIHLDQMTLLCKAFLLLEWGVDLKETEKFFAENRIDPHRLFKILFKQKFAQALKLDGPDCEKYERCSDAPSFLKYGSLKMKNSDIEDSCEFLCDLMKKAGSWGKMQRIGYDGIEQFDLCVPYPSKMKVPVDQSEDPVPSPFLKDHWDNLKKKLAK